MKYEEEYTNLSNAIRWGNQSMLLNTLNKNSDLDLTYKEGKFFILAVEDNNIKIVEPLLDYFNNNQLVRYENRSLEYILLKNKMRDVLEIAIEDVSLSEEMKKQLSLYINFEDEEQDISDYQEEDFDLIYTPPMKKLQSADDIESHSKKTSSTHDNSNEKVLTKAILEEWELMQLKNDLKVGYDLKQGDISYLFEDQSTRDSPESELIGKEQVTNSEEF